MEIVELFIWANSMPEERFVPIKDFEGRYWISDFGRIVSHDQRKNCVNFLTPYVDDQGYYAPTLRMKPKKGRSRLHVLVAEHFLEKDSPEQTNVNHKTGIKLWNYYKDLEWTTPQENTMHAVNTGLHNLKGERHPLNKLKKEQVIEIRSLYRIGLTHKQIAEKFGICRRQAGDIINGKNWGWLN